MRARLIVPLIACSLLAFLGLRELPEAAPQQARYMSPFQGGDLLPTAAQSLPSAGPGDPLTLELQRLPSDAERLHF
ncbi:hypothetical protein [Pseudomonas sp. ML96]|uniref:hypothetical protein n=1 Tax=Pseudomonas sp. ML96 TaxID=1523503 RepID=UPI0005BD41AD|nr:hypothetical protein [Pseudomonas sp. ML96]